MTTTSAAGDCKCGPVSFDLQLSEIMQNSIKFSKSIAMYYVLTM